MYCREQFLKCPPDEYAKSHLLDKASKAQDDNAKKSRRRDKHKKSAQDDSSNWVTDVGESSDDDLSPRRRREKMCAMKEQIKWLVMREIYEAQTEEVKEVILRLYTMQVKRKVLREKRELYKSAPLVATKKRKKRFNRRNNNNTKGKGHFVPKAGPAALQNNRKVLARLQRRRRCRGKPRSTHNRRKKYPRFKRRVNAKKGNRQGKKRYLRAQKLFDKGFFVFGHRLLDEVWQAVKDPKTNSTSFCNNNIHCLSKIHRKQIALYEMIEEDLHRLDVARQERAEAAAEREVREKEKEELRRELKNKIEARAAARAERNALRKERRAARKQRALEKRLRKERAKTDELKYIERQSGRIEAAVIS